MELKGIVFRVHRNNVSHFCGVVLKKHNNNVGHFCGITLRKLNDKKNDSALFMSNFI